MGLVWLLLGCGGGAPGFEVTPADPLGFETRFRGAEPWVPDAAAAERIRALCPSVRSVTWQQETESALWVSVRGDGFDAVDRVGAVLSDGKLADAKHQAEAGGIGFVVACRDCEVLFAVIDEGRPVACVGPSRSVIVRAAVPTARH